MKIPHNIYQFHFLTPKVIWWSLAIALAKNATAAGPVETWETNFNCGDNSYIIESHCRSSKKPFDLNQCLTDQTLSGGAHKIRVPSTAPANDATPLFAIAWGCTLVRNNYYITLSYSSGQGRSEQDELSEVFTLNLQPVIERALQVEAFRNENMGRHGPIRSILPDGEANE